MYLIVAALLILSIFYFRKQKPSSAKEIVMFCVLIGICAVVTVIYKQTKYEHGLVHFMIEKF